MKSVYVIAILAAAISTSAVAKDLRQDKKAAAPAATATQMSDAEMDKVTAGAVGFGLDTAFGGPGQSQHQHPHELAQGLPGITPSGVSPGFGKATAP
jgi:hypothetical protein